MHDTGHTGGMKGANVMEGSFENGTVLWYWYEMWIVAAALGLAGLLTARLLVQTPWTGAVPVFAKALAVLGLAPVLTVVLDRVGVYTAVREAETFGYVSIAGAAVAVVLGLLTPMLRGGSTSDAAENADNSPSPSGTLTPETGLTADTAAMTAPVPPGDTGTLTAMGPGATVGQVPAGDAATQAVGRAGATQMGGAAATQAVGGAQPAARLVVRGGKEAGKSFPLSEAVTTIGRSSDNAIVLSDSAVSRHHARLTRSGDSYTLEDLESSAGTSVGGARVRREVLRPGAVVRLGETDLVFEAPGAAGDPPTMVATAAAPRAGLGDSPGGATMVLGQERAAAWLLVRKGTGAGQSFGLNAEHTTIGRSPESGVRLDDQAVSRDHALVRRVGDTFILYDIGSVGGTQVNGQPLAGAPIRDGSRIVLGASELMFTPVEGGAQAPPAPGGQTMVLRQEARGALMVRSGPASGQSFALGEQDLVIGREPGPGGAALSDSAISRRHALVRRTPDGYTVYDLGSANGTTVDGVALSGRTLQSGDVVSLGSTELQFVQGG